ncbi:MAG TPA: ABC transporter ATP-binding protein [Chryseolinea sp.]
MVKIINFSKRFSGELIVDIPILELSSGAYWIKGDNGAGKTTFFRSLAGLIPCAGDVEFEDGVSLKHSPIQYRKRVAYAEAEPLFPPYLTSKDLLSFVAKARNSAPVQLQLLTKKFGIDQYREKSCATYSSGMLKKLSLAIAFLGSPKLIILDEPLITLDENAQTILTAIIEEYIRDQQATILLSSHHLLENTELKIEKSFTIKDKILIASDPA